MLNINLEKDIQCNDKKKKGKKTNNDLQNITQETLHKTWDGVRFPGRISTSRFTGDTSRNAHVQNMSLKRKRDWDYDKQNIAVVNVKLQPYH